MRCDLYEPRPEFWSTLGSTRFYTSNVHYYHTTLFQRLESRYSNTSNRKDLRSRSSREQTQCLSRLQEPYRVKAQVYTQRKQTRQRAMALAWHILRVFHNYLHVHRLHLLRTVLFPLRYHSQLLRHLMVRAEMGKIRKRYLHDMHILKSCRLRTHSTDQPTQGAHSQRRRDWQRRRDCRRHAKHDRTAIRLRLGTCRPKQAPSSRRCTSWAQLR